MTMVCLVMVMVLYISLEQVLCHRERPNCDFHRQKFYRFYVDQAKQRAGTVILHPSDLFQDQVGRTERNHKRINLLALSGPRNDASRQRLPQLAWTTSL